MKITINLFETLLRMTMHRTNLSQLRTLNKDNDFIRNGRLMKSHWHITARSAVSILSLHLCSTLCTLLVAAWPDLELRRKGRGFAHPTGLSFFTKMRKEANSPSPRPLPINVLGTNLYRGIGIYSEMNRSLNKTRSYLSIKSHFLVVQTD